MLIYLIIVLIVVFILAVGAGILFLLQKAFKLPEVTYKKSLITTVIPTVVALILGIILFMWNVDIAKIVMVIITFAGFYYFLKKYYAIGFGKILSIFILNGIILSIAGPLIIIPFRASIMEPFVVAGHSMEPSFHVNDYLFIRKFDLKVKRGDVIVYRSPKDNNSIFIHRVVGLPGDKIEFQSGKVLINGKELSEPYAQGQTLGNVSLNLGSQDYFVLGDNREVSADSRTLGTIPRQNIIGVVFKTSVNPLSNLNRQK
jgi:signal peptidase I